MVVVVTGASSGLGRAIALRLGGSGRDLALFDRDEQGLKATMDRVRPADGSRVMTVRVDVSDPSSVRDGFAAVRQDCGPVSILVNSAGIADLQPAATMPVETFTRVFSVNVTGTFLCCQEAARDMRAARRGAIVNLASISGLRASMGRVAYGPSKAAVISLTSHLAVEWALDGITVNAVAPGPIETPMAAASHDAGNRRAYLDRIPAGRYGEAEEVAAAVAYLISDEARFVTGQTLAVDGGYAVAGLLAR